MLKVKEIREKTSDELNEELKSLQKELLENRLQFHSRNLDNTASMRITKKSIARVLTVLKEKELEESANA